MFVIVYYDIQEKRCAKALKICRKYIQWVQNSVFEGEISEANLEKMIEELKKIIKLGKNDSFSKDSIVMYKFRTKNFTERLIYGADKRDDIQFL